MWHYKKIALQSAVTITHFTTQNGGTALIISSFHGQHKVVELLLVAGANPDLQEKVRTGRDGTVHSNLSNVNGTCFVL